MKTGLLIISLILTGQISWSQQVFDWKQLLSGTTANLDLFINSIDSDSIDSGNRLSVYDYYNRTLTPSFNERVIFLEDSYGFDSTRSSWRNNNYLISVIQRHDSIVFAQVDTIISVFDLEKEETSVPVFQLESNKLMKKVEEEFNQIYHTRLRRDELFNTSIWYGLRCGRTALVTNEYSKVIDYVENKQINKLRNYLTSTCLEKQLFGVQGFYELKTEDDFTIEPTDQTLIDFILSKSGQVIYCRGCGVLRMEVSVFKEKFGF